MKEIELDARQKRNGSIRNMNMEKNNKGQLDRK